MRVRRHHAEGATVAVGAARSRLGRGGSAHMADVLYVALLIGMFLLLALTLRGLERL